MIALPRQSERIRQAVTAGQLAPALETQPDAVRGEVRRIAQVEPVAEEPEREQRRARVRDPQEVRAGLEVARGRSAPIAERSLDALHVRVEDTQVRMAQIRLEHRGVQGHVVLARRRAADEALVVEREALT